MNENNDKIYFAETNFRNKRVRFGIKKDDRRKHIYIVGKTGMGKTTLLENMAIQDMQKGEAMGIIDPHGEFAKKMLDFVPKERIDDVIYFDPSDLHHPIGFNIMENVDPEKRHLIASGLMGVFKKIWVDVWSARMEYILANTILALLEYPGATLLGINRMLSNKDFRKKVVDCITDPIVKSFWVDEFAKYTDRYAQEAVPAVMNKVGQFISNPLIRNIIGQPKSSFDMREVMDGRKILIMNLSKGSIGEENSRLIGAMLITKLYLGALSRTDSYGKDFPDFHLYVDEFQNFATESFANILSEARKYRLNLILAHQYIAQMDETVSDAVFGNVGTMITFRVGAADAEVIEKEFSPEFFVKDIVSLAFANIYLKLMIDGVASRPFSASTLPPIQAPALSYREQIVESSRKRYGVPLEVVTANIAKLHEQDPAVIPRRDISSPRDTPARTREEYRPPMGNVQQDSEAVQRPSGLYEAVCEVCGKDILVPFQPDGRRPIYCKQHRNPVQKDIGAPSMRMPGIKEGEVVTKEAPLSRPTISLSELRDPPKISSRNKVPDINELRKALAETLQEEADEPDDSGKKENTTNQKDAKLSDLKDKKPEPNQAPRQSFIPRQEQYRDNKPIKKDGQNNRSGILKPGESIKFE
ncbi:MAG: hypothetical protein COU46_00730 [Candidatus Niyogibacteria bacterium CG10_big_fil_rev_8_21_14_0_10_42_19]|uniref:Uncharacterized protein n=1 Tax=Candidatus Niyogibacteria bacterium CG10_big_fil_rev_8_21_14_0_10_42_19 TaxID=1974725 RepID=A0A2H0TGB3_9BACT|nr:MAG: hypothetical protein COU46_00730 [Candidatus Niyogibacteria bacterium CG10_big_fil_rev_8_21_14_0_10_42_19]